MNDLTILRIVFPLPRLRKSPYTYPVSIAKGFLFRLCAIHGRDDELFDLALIEFAVEDRGHYEAFRYVDALRGAVEWLENTVWDMQ